MQSQVRAMPSWFVPLHPIISSPRYVITAIENERYSLKRSGENTFAAFVTFETMAARDKALAIFPKSVVGRCCMVRI